MTYLNRLRLLVIAAPLGAAAIIGGSVAVAASQDGSDATSGAGQVAQQQATPSPEATPATPATPEGTDGTDGTKPSGDDCADKGGRGQDQGESSGSGTSTRFRAGSQRAAGALY